MVFGKIHAFFSIGAIPTQHIGCALGPGMVDLLDKDQVFETVQKLKKSTPNSPGIFSLARKELGLQKSHEELDNLRQIYNRKLESKVYDKTLKSWTGDDCSNAFID